MGREVRRVPPGWKHPTNNIGEPIPLLTGPYKEARAEWDEGQNKWDTTPERPGMTFAEWHGREPQPEAYMPEFPEGTATHLMMYETCSEGTPISPAFATPEELAHWLADNNASAFGSNTATYEQWLSMVKRGWAVSAAVVGNELVSGVEAQHKE